MKLLFTAPLYVSNELHNDFAFETINSIKTKYDSETLLVENFVAPQFKKAIEDNVKTIPNPYGNSVSGAWNMGIRYGIENNFDYIFVINLDIIFHKDAIDTLVDYAVKNPEPAIWTCAEWANRRTFSSIEIKDNLEDSNKLIVSAGGEDHDWEKTDKHPHFSCFMLNKNSIDRLAKAEEGTAEREPGYFDIGFQKAYFEDQDYHQRLLRAGLESVKVNSAIFFHYGSRTIKSDEVLEMQNVHSYEANRAYFKEKWGYDSHGRVPTDQERLELGYKKAFNK